MGTADDIIHNNAAYDFFIATLLFSKCLEFFLPISYIFMKYFSIPQIVTLNVKNNSVAVIGNHEDRYLIFHCQLPDRNFQRNGVNFFDDTVNFFARKE